MSSLLLLRCISIKLVTRLLLRSRYPHKIVGKTKRALSLEK
jgi:hypothetical protein